MFMGEYNHSLDAKGRLIVPSKFREELGETFVVTQGLDNCLFVFSMKEWGNFVKGLQETPQTTKDGRKFLRFLLSGAKECEVDKQGRVSIPEKLRNFAKLQKDVVTVGVLNRVEIWDKDMWLENNTYENMDEIAEHMAEYGLNL